MKKPAILSTPFTRGTLWLDAGKPVFSGPGPEPCFALPPDQQREADAQCPGRCCECRYGQPNEGEAPT